MHDANAQVMWIPQGRSLLQPGVASNWWGLGCPSYCRGSALLLGLVFLVGFASGAAGVLYLFRSSLFCVSRKRGQPVQVVRGVAPAAKVPAAPAAMRSSNACCGLLETILLPQKQPGLRCDVVGWRGYGRCSRRGCIDGSVVCARSGMRGGRRSGAAGRCGSARQPSMTRSKSKARCSPTHQRCFLHERRDVHTTVLRRIQVDGRPRAGPRRAARRGLEGPQLPAARFASWWAERSVGYRQYSKHARSRTIGGNRATTGPAALAGGGIFIRQCFVGTKFRVAAHAYPARLGTTWAGSGASAAEVYGWWGY